MYGSDNYNGRTSDIWRGVLANCPIILLINRTQWPTANETHVLVKIKKQMNVEDCEVHLKGGRYERALSKIGNASSTKSIKR